MRVAVGPCDLCTCTHTHTHTHTHTQANACMYICMYGRTHASTYESMLMHTQTPTRPCTQIEVFTYSAFTRDHMHMAQTQTLKGQTCIVYPQCSQSCMYARM